MKNFLITIDTEGDNLWEWKQRDKITTENVKYLPRFQELCNKYEFKPVWLTNWEMLNDDDYVQFIKCELEMENCELGMHLHSWNTPPFYDLPKCKQSRPPYLIEYPREIMDEKVKVITQAFIKRFGFSPISHRAGRWAINDDYFDILRKYGYKIDCSIIPGMDLRLCKGQTPGFDGPDYSKEMQQASFRRGIIEIPVTMQNTHKFFINRQDCLRKQISAIYHSLIGRIIWLRPRPGNLAEMLWCVQRMEKSESDYLMFMIHSSELMPGGSPTFKTEKDIEYLYNDLKILFDYISNWYKGITLKDYISISKSIVKESETK